MKKHMKVAITGANGQIGYALIFRLASGQLFGDTKLDLHLIELPHGVSALNGVQMELEDCAFPYLNQVVCTSDLAEGMRGVDLALLVGAAPRKAGMERADLLKINGKIFAEQGRAINDNAGQDVKVFVVGNPCNTNSLIARHNAPDIPSDRFFAMTTLDELRACSMLANKAKQPVSAVSNMTIWGNHSATQYPDFYHAKINGRPVPEVISDHQWLEQDFISAVQQRGAKVIEARGASSAASAANAIMMACSRLYQTTPLQQSFSMVLASSGQYDVPEGLMFSFPCRTTEQGRIEVIENLQHNAFGQEKFAVTLKELEAERAAVKALSLIE